ncbi:MAG: ribosome small subunit-dependent GTPase A [Calditrichaeota bacterium]|nr:ribosome small subunit-dependent GTPase A [Calditrichota bacterium]RQV93392.1 MAG: ribosome small subunit-dependent GTPase A [bacterium]
MNIINLGFDPWFQSRMEQYSASDFSPARITSVDKNSYMVHNGETEINAELTGKFLYGSESVLDLPTVGDWVVVEYFNGGTLAIIHDLLPRKTLLKRKDPGKKVNYQLVAANVDTAFIIQSVDSNFNLNRLERYLVTVNDGGVRPVILLSKSDLIGEKERSEKTAALSRVGHEIKHIFYSNVNGEGMESVLGEMLPGRTCCLLGSSGVGKTTLINRLLGEERFEVKEVREKDGRGRHATTRRQLIRLDNGSILIDTPGMREIAAFGLDSGLAETFEDIFTVAQRCRFSDCSHTHEKGCAVVEAVRDGEIEEERYKNFMKVQRESAFYQMSYFDRRKRDKEFGKMIKQVMKNYRKK